METDFLWRIHEPINKVVFCVRSVSTMLFFFSLLACKSVSLQYFLNVKTCFKLSTSVSHCLILV